MRIDSQSTLVLNRHGCSSVVFSLSFKGLDPWVFPLATFVANVDVEILLVEQLSTEHAVLVELAPVAHALALNVPGAFDDGLPGGENHFLVALPLLVSLEKGRHAIRVW